MSQAFPNKTLLYFEKLWSKNLTTMLDNNKWINCSAKARVFPHQVLLLCMTTLVTY